MRWRAEARPLLAPVPTLTLLAALLAGAACGGGEGGGGRTAEPGGPPALRGVTTDGEPFSLDSFRGEPVVVVFLRGLDCGLCRLRLSRLAAHADEYRQRGAPVLAVVPRRPGAADGGERFGRHVTVVVADRAELVRWGVWPVWARAPLPAAFVFADDGRRLFARVGRTAAERASDEELLGVLASRRPG